VSEQRDEAASGGVRQGLEFYARCAQEAWRRSWDVAKAWPPILGLLVLYGGAHLAGIDLTFPGDVEYGAAIGTALFIAIAWLAVFLVQFVAAPPRLYARLDAERLAPMPRPEPLLLTELVEPIAEPSPPARDVKPVLALPAPLPPLPAPRPAPALVPRAVLPTLDVRLHDQMHETAALDTTGARLPTARAYMARIANRGDKRLRRCQIFFCNPTHIQVVSGPFDLAPGEHRDLPVLRVIDQADEPHALLYFLDGETWAVADGQAAWLPEPGRFKVKVLSANAPATSLDVTLSRSAGAPAAWTLVEAVDAQEAAPAGRKRQGWAVPDAVAEPSAGD
jgi:hypothetical protein